MFLRGRPITMYVPSGYGGGLRAELPPERLQLDWVYPAWGAKLVRTGRGADPQYGLGEGRGHHQYGLGWGETPSID